MALLDLVTLPVRLTVAAVASGGTLDQLVALGVTLEGVQPRLAELAALIPELHESVNTLNSSVGPLGEPANRLPGRRRPALEG